MSLNLYWSANLKKMITRRLENVVIFIQTILSFVLSRKIIIKMIVAFWKPFHIIKPLIYGLSKLMSKKEQSFQ